MKITEEVLTAYLHCKYKAYLLLTDVVQEPSEYEQWLQRHDQDIAAATRVLLEREEALCLPSHTPLTSEHLTQGLTTILGAHVEDVSCVCVPRLTTGPWRLLGGLISLCACSFGSTGQAVHETQTPPGLWHPCARKAPACPSAQHRRQAETRTKLVVLTSGHSR